MGTPYTGQASPPFSQDTSFPLPGAAATIQIPADLDANNVGVMFAVQYRQIADFLAYQQASIATRPPLSPAVTAGTTRAYTPIVKTGTGTSVAAFSVSQLPYVSNAAQAYLIEVTAAGILGTAQIKISTDGGTTFAAPFTVAGTGIVSSGNVKVTFSAGTFVVGDRFSYFPADTSVAKWYGNTDNTSRLSVDHLGLSQRAYAAFHEDWEDSPTGAPPVTLVGAASGAIPGMQKYQYAIPSATGGSLAWPLDTVNGTSNDRQLGVTLDSGGAAARAARIGSMKRPFAHPNQSCSSVFTARILGVNSQAVSVSDMALGISDALDTLTGSNFVAVRHLNAADGSFWIATWRIGAGAIGTAALTTVVQFGVSYVFRFEIVNMNFTTPKFRWFLNNILVHEVDGTGLAANLGWSLANNQTIAGTGGQWNLGRLSYMHAASSLGSL